MRRWNTWSAWSGGLCRRWQFGKKSKPLATPAGHCKGKIPLASALATPRICRICYRCTCKTSVAQLLADKLGWSWLDADSTLEQRYRRTIRQIFAEDGEAVFRDMEAAILAELCQFHRHI